MTNMTGLTTAQAIARDVQAEQDQFDLHLVGWWLAWCIVLTVLTVLGWWVVDVLNDRRLK